MAKKDSGEDILKAILEKGGQGAKGKEALEKAAAEIQAATKNLNTAAEAQKTAAQKQSTAATSQQQAAAKQTAAAQKASQRPATSPGDVSRLTQKIAGAPGASAAGVAGVVGGAIKESTIGNALSFKNMAAATSEALGVRGLGLTLGSAAGGARGGGGGATAKSEFNVQMLELLDTLVVVNKDNKDILISILDAIKGNQAQNIEAQREGAAIPATGGNAGAAGQAADKEGGGFLAGLKGFAGKALDPIIGLFKSLGPVLTGLSRFALTVAAPVAALVAIVASLEQQDWAKIFGNISAVFDDLIKGDYLTAILRSISTIADAIVTGVGRLLANVLKFIGLESAAEAIHKFLDDFNLADKIVNFVKAIPEMVVSAYKNVKETVSQWINSAFDFADQVIESVKGMAIAVAETFVTIRDKVVDKLIELTNVYVSTIFTTLDSFFDSLGKAWDKLWNGDILGGLTELWAALPNAVFKGVGNLISKIAKFFGFEDVSKQIDDFLATFDLAKSVTDFGTNVKDKVTQSFGAMWDAVSQWWDNVSIVDPMIGAFTNVKDKVTEVFGNVMESVKDVIGFDVGGYIAEKISNVTGGITKLFKDMPNSLVNALPDGFVKTTLQKFIGSGETTNTPRDSSPTPTTPYVPREEPTYDAMGNFTGMSVMPVENPSAMSAVQGSAAGAVAAATGGSSPVVINNNMGGGGATQAAPPAPRTSGAIGTAPAPSLLDRTLYGNAYGAGVP